MHTQPASLSPSREEVWLLVNEFAVGAYRMYALRNIDLVIVKIPPEWNHSFRDVLLNPMQDAFPRALVVLAHATLEGVLRNVGKSRHVNRRGHSPWKSEFWSLSTLKDLDNILKSCRLPEMKDGEIRLALAGLMERRHSIVHRSDFPITQASIDELHSKLFTWVGTVIFYSKRVIEQSFPSLSSEAYADLKKLLEHVESDWRRLISA